MKTINCQIVINGEQKWMPLELNNDGEKCFASLRLNVNVPLEKTLVKEPSDGLAAWNYSGSIVVQVTTKPNGGK